MLVIQNNLKLNVEPCTLNLRKYKLLSNILMASLDFVKLLWKTFKGLFPAPPLLELFARK